MNKWTIAVFTFVFLGVGLIYAVARLDSTLSEPAELDPAVLVEPRSHLATSEMIDAAGAMAGQEAPGFRMLASDGATYSLAEPADEGPLALFFIKDGCPCSRAAQPYFDQLHRAYGERIRFLGVIDGDADVARRWSAENRVPFPILCDQTLEIVHQYRVENSAYVVLVEQGGVINKYWPGYSAGMLKDAGERLAKLASIPEKPLDLGEAPEILYSGCPF